MRECTISLPHAGASVVVTATAVAPCIINDCIGSIEDATVGICHCNGMSTCSEVIVNCCCSKCTSIDRISIRSDTTGHCTKGECTVRLSAGCICCSDCNRSSSACIINICIWCIEDTTVGIGYCNGISTCSKIIVNCCCSKWTAIDRISIRSDTTGYGTNSECTVRLTAGCISCVNCITTAGPPRIIDRCIGSIEDTTIGIGY